MRRLVVVAAVLTLASCVPVRRMSLSRPAVGAAETVKAEAKTVAANDAFLVQRGTAPGVFAVSVTARNDGDQPAFLALDHATLVVADPAGDLAEVTLAAWTSGGGEVPEVIPERAKAAPLALYPGESATFWIAFRTEKHEALAERDLPRRIVVRVPVANASRPIELVVAEPMTGRPRWVAPPIRSASYGGLSVIGVPFDEGSFGILRTSGKTLVGENVVLGPSFYLGVRGGDLRGERERTIVCCDLGMSFDVSLPFVRAADSSFGPYFSYQSVFALERGRIDKATWHGPAAGLQFFTRLLEPIVAGALPVRPSRTPLGYSSFTIAYAHLFRRGDPGGSPGMLLLFERTFPEW